MQACRDFQLINENMPPFTIAIISQYTTAITPGSEPFVHHMLIYLCPASESDRQVDSGNCEAEEEGDSTLISEATEKCRHGILIAAWAVGGEVYIYNVFARQLLAFLPLGFCLPGRCGLPYWRRGKTTVSATGDPL